MLYGTSPVHMDFSGSDDELMELCGLGEDLCHFEWHAPLTLYRDSLLLKRSLQVHDSMGAPIAYEQGVGLITGRWCRRGQVGLARDGSLQQDEIDVKWEGDGLVGDSQGDKRLIGQPRNHHGHFAVEIDMGGFPLAPMFGFLTHPGKADGAIHVVFPNGITWFREPEV